MRAMWASAVPLLLRVQDLRELLDPLLLDLLDVGAVDLAALLLRLARRSGRGLDASPLLGHRVDGLVAGGEHDLVLEDLLAHDPPQTALSLHLDEWGRAAVELHHPLLEKRGERELPADLPDEDFFGVDVEQANLLLVMPDFQVMPAPLLSPLP